MDVRSEAEMREGEEEGAEVSEMFPEEVCTVDGMGEPEALPGRVMREEGRLKSDGDRLDQRPMGWGGRGGGGEGDEL